MNNSPSAIRLMVVEDHAVVRQGLMALLRTVPGLQVVAEAGRGDDAVRSYMQYRPDVTLMDLRLPGMSGVEAIRAIRKGDAAARIVVLTTYDGDEDIHRALEAGAQGYLLKGMDVEELVTAIRAVARGSSRIPAVVAEKLAERLPGQQLSDREMDVLRLIVAGKSNREIGEALFISESTVKTHINNLLGKMGVADRTQAATSALQRGLVHLE